MLASYYGIVPERSEDGKFCTDFQIVRQYVSSEANAGESANLIYIHTYIHTFIHEWTVLTKSQYNGYIKQLPILCHLFITICMHTCIVTYIHIHRVNARECSGCLSYSIIPPIASSRVHRSLQRYALMHTYIYTYIHTHIHTYIHIYIHTYIYTYIHTYIHIYIHTYIHAYIHGHHTSTCILQVFRNFSLRAMFFTRYHTYTW